MSKNTKYQALRSYFSGILTRYYYKNHRSILVPFDHQSIGGPATFLKHLKFGLEAGDYEHTVDYFSNYDRIFFPIEYAPDRLDKLKSRGVKIIQRLDGVYYPSKSGPEADYLNRNILKIYRDLADGIVFQSKYSELQCKEVLGSPTTNNIYQIFNGTDLSIFKPNSSYERNNSDQWKFITTGNFRDFSMIEPLVMALDDLARGGVDFQLLCVGPITNEEIQSHFDRDYIKHSETSDMQVLADELRESDIFLYSHVNPPCPNSVIEAIACALPVVGFNSGAMNELCSFNTELLAYVSDEVLHEYQDFRYELLFDKIKLCISNFDSFKNRSLENWKNYDREGMIHEYMNLFDNF
tara:strand:- start:16964 stop:18019 length:1056 start_codon:yes stop_codon:yes gene_type:complete